MNVIKPLASGLIGTTAMTLFSYVTGHNRGNEPEEPALLYELLQRSRLPGFRGESRERNHLLGWAIHYATGQAFAALYGRLWKETKLKPGLPAGIVLGTLTGVVGITGWDLLLRLHHNPPELDRKAFYKHLMASHVIYGMFSALGYRAPK